MTQVSSAIQLRLEAITGAELSFDRVTVDFDGVRAVDDLSFTISPGEVAALVGPNGSGKTTACNVAFGRVRPRMGTVSIAGRAVSGMPAHRVAKMGVSRTFQEVRLFRGFTVLDNVRFALRRGAGETLAAALFGASGRDDTDEACQWLARVGLAERAQSLAADLSFGQAKLLEIVRALCVRPRLVILDEPAAGLSSQGLDRLGGLFEWLRERQSTVMFIEHNLCVVRDVADRVLVLGAGRLLGDLRADDLKRDGLINRVFSGG